MKMAVSKRNAEYWRKRMKQMETSILDQSYDYVENLERQFDLAVKDIETKILAWYQRLADNNNITLAEAKKMLKADELEEFKWTVEEYIKRGNEYGLSRQWMKELENASARVHISRLDAMKLQIKQLAEELQVKQLAAVEEASRQAYVNSYYHTVFELQKGFGFGWTMQLINDTVVEKVLSKPWTMDGKTFSYRIWDNMESLVNTVNTQLTQMLIKGESPQNAVDAIAKRFHTSKNNAGRLVMTESAFFASVGQRDCYKGLDVEQYEIVATLDSNTCSTCGDLDSKVFKLSDYEPGVTAPPFHPWCRCCTCPYFSDMEDMGERFARDYDGRTYNVPGNMTYKDWAKKSLTQSENSGIINKKAYTKIKSDDIPSMDAARFDRIKERLSEKGINVIQDADGDAYLKAMSAEAMTLSDGSAIIFQSHRVPSASACFEEIIHTTQIRTRGMIGNFGDNEAHAEYLNREIEANEKLLKYRKAYGLTDYDVESVKINLKKYYDELREGKMICSQ